MLCKHFISVVFKTLSSVRHCKIYAFFCKSSIHGVGPVNSVSPCSWKTTRKNASKRGKYVRLRVALAPLCITLMQSNVLWFDLLSSNNEWKVNSLVSDTLRSGERASSCYVCKLFTFTRVSFKTYNNTVKKLTTHVPHIIISKCNNVILTILFLGVYLYFVAIEIILLFLWDMFWTLL